MKQHPTPSQAQSAAPILVLTRPIDGARRVLAAVEAALGHAPCAVLSPILAITPIGPWPDLGAYRNVILTSAHACRGSLAGLRAYCVGARTAEVAQGKGAMIAHVAPDAAALWDHIPAMDPPAIYLRGREISVDLAAQYGCDAAIVYGQEAQPLSAPAKQALCGEGPVILPLFSPRSARLVAQEIGSAGPRLQVIAMSAAVKKAWEEALPTGIVPPPVDICAAPTQVEMVSRIVASLGEA